MKIAYLVNQYPKVSHSFIRREILSVEATGIEVSRFSIRSLGAELVDQSDLEEFEKTKFVLGVGIVGLVVGLIRVLLQNPISFWNTLLLTLKISLGSERGLLIHLAYFAEACVLLGWLSKLNIDQVHAHFGTNSTTVAMLCHALGGPPYSFTVHGPEEFDKVKAIALPEKIKRAKFVVAISSFGKSQLYRWCDYKQWSKIKIVRCGVDQMFLNQSYIPIPQESRFVCVGRLSEQKGHLLLVEAASKLATMGQKFKLVFVGDGELRSEIESLIAQFQLEEYIEITGWATNAEVRQQILDSQILVLPSFAEGLPVVLMEALALSRPVISTYIAGIPELIEPGKSGWLVPSGSIDSLVNAMEIALQTPREKLEEMGKLGASQVGKAHNINIEVSKLVEFFKS
ncbi:MAG: glycosyltransferase [Microcoleaceae cyanobacterium MO_207.B10]|nr:glycosyltransferase [Microcoleaceae cyanobacterium MO_207.B10]